MGRIPSYDGDSYPGRGVTGAGMRIGPCRRAGAGLLVVFLALAVVLAGCATERKKHKARMICPATAVVSGTGALTEFAEGPGRDEDDVVYRAEISNLTISCKKRGKGIETAISFEISAWPGPADTAGSARVPFFVAIATKDNRLVTKKVFFSDHRFAADDSSSRFREHVTQFVPGTKKKPAKDYEILIGFQLSPDQLEYNFFR